MTGLPSLPAAHRPARSARIVWSAVDNPDRRVQSRLINVIWEIADHADVDLKLSSGLRLGDHGNHGVGRAVDISAINGVDIGREGVTNPAAAPLVARLQAVAKDHPEVRENFGPSGLWKSPRRGERQVDFDDGSSKRRRLQQQHLDHVHISVHP